MNDNSQVTWEDPPEDRGHGSWVRDLAPLMDHPGRWARVRDMPLRSAGSAVTMLKKRRLNYPAGRWEFTSRGTGDGRGFVYARYLGPEAAQP